MTEHMGLFQVMPKKTKKTQTDPQPNRYTTCSLLQSSKSQFTHNYSAEKCKMGFLTVLGRLMPENAEV